MRGGQGFQAGVAGRGNGVCQLQKCCLGRAVCFKIHNRHAAIGSHQGGGIQRHSAQKLQRIPFGKFFTAALFEKVYFLMAMRVIRPLIFSTTPSMFELVY